MCDAILDALDETKVWRFLAARQRAAHINAPACVLKRILARGDDPQFSYSTELREDRLTGKNIFVWDLDPERLKHARRRFSSCRVMGILRDVWPATLCGADLFGARTSTGSPPVCYAVVCSPRSGSTFLCDLLGAAGFGNPKEHVREAFIEVCKSPYSFTELLGWMMERGGCGGYFGTKLVSHYLDRLGTSPLSLDGLEVVLKARNFRIIHLQRDPAEQAISSYFAHRTGVWHIRAATISDLRHAEVSYAFDELRGHYDAVRAANQRVDLFVQRFDNVLGLRYDDLDSDYRSALLRIAEFLGMPRDTISHVSPKQLPQKISRNIPRMQEYLSRFVSDLRAV